MKIFFGISSCYASFIYRNYVRSIMPKYMSQGIRKREFFKAWAFITNFSENKYKMRLLFMYLHYLVIILYKINLVVFLYGHKTLGSESAVSALVNFRR